MDYFLKKDTASAISDAAFNGLISPITSMTGVDLKLESVPKSTTKSILLTVIKEEIKEKVSPNLDN